MISGLYVTVKESQWNFAVQECLKSNILKSFCCDNHYDADQLIKIVNKYYAANRSKPSIITTKFTNEVSTVLILISINVLIPCLMPLKQ